MMSTYILGYGFALLFGQLTGLVVDQMYGRIDPDLSSRDSRWQPWIVGVTERTLYVTMLLVGKGEFIALWVGLKVAIPYLRWQPQTVGEGSEEDETAKNARRRYLNSLCGNALSILYAAVGYGIIKWLPRCHEDYAIWASVAMVGGTLVLWLSLKLTAPNNAQTDKKNPD